MSLPETPTRVVLFLSTLSLRRATFLFADHIELRAISIHALLAESDQPATKQAQNLLNFYPRSPCGERRTKTAPALRGLYFYPRSPCGERLHNRVALIPHQQFLSTLSLRRATARSRCRGCPATYFYPRSPCGERLIIMLYDTSSLIFLSTLSLRRATLLRFSASKVVTISIHALLAESDLADCTKF